MADQQAPYPHLPLFSRCPHVPNIAVHSGNRHLSRIHTNPAPALRPRDPYPDATARIVRNRKDAPAPLLMALTDIKNVICRQLPVMGPLYITRLVYDFEAESVVLYSEGQICAAIVSRLFEKEKFVEIAFLAVEARLQSQGLGRTVMAFQKSVCQARGMFDILTCADNDAVVFFKKQGFNEKAIRMDPNRWVGYIKDYEGVTLAHCLLHPEIDYFTFTERFLAPQLDFVRDKTGMQISEPLPEFLDDLQAIPHAVVNVSLTLPALFRRCCPGLQSPRVQQLLEDYDGKCQVLRNKLLKILTSLKGDRNADIFLEPVTEDIAEGYFDEIDSPMDISAIETRLTKFADYYKRPEIFSIDVTLMCENAKQYNAPETAFYHEAVDLLRLFKRLYGSNFPELGG
jgi:histone acetyltransferase